MMMDKSTILKNIEKTENTINEVLTQLNKFDCLRVMHSVLESFDNEMTYNLKEMISNGKQNETLNISVYRNTLQHLGIIISAINYTLLNSKNNNSTLSETPIIDMILRVSEHSVFPSDKDMMLKERYDPTKDECISNDVHLLGGTFNARRYYVIKNFYRTNGQKQIIFTLKLLMDFWQLAAFRTLLHSNISAEITDTGEIRPVDLTPQILLELEEMNARTIGVEHNKFPSWRLHIKEMHELTIAASRIKRVSPISREIIFRGLKMELAEFAKLENFHSVFFQKYSIQFHLYCSIIEQIVNIIYSSNSTCVYLPKSRLLTKIKKTTNCKITDIEKIINPLIWEKGSSIFEKPVILDGIHYIFSWVTMANGLLAPIYRCYDELIDNDLKGRLFENECRKAFRDDANFIFNDRLVINRPILPDEASVKLWGYIKKRTDLDVLAIKNDILFILECKSKKTPLSKRIRVDNLFMKYYEELLYKANWVSQNFEEFRQIANSQKCEISENCKFIVPLLVSNLMNIKNQNFLVNNMTELQSILKKINSPLPTPQFHLLLDSNVNVIIPSFEIRQKS
jgi:hypothetical protein